VGRAVGAALWHDHEPVVLALYTWRLRAILDARSGADDNAATLWALLCHHFFCVGHDARRGQWLDAARLWRRDLARAAPFSCALCLHLYASSARPCTTFTGACRPWYACAGATMREGATKQSEAKLDAA